MKKVKVPTSELPCPFLFLELKFTKASMHKDLDSNTLLQKLDIEYCGESVWLFIAFYRNA